ncbi:MAG TPA: alpha/beta hydrolase [Ktedonobacterales bacterium]|nr:alpha/beta hydrolase [Ktedonobacterales bacterium]
MSRTVCKNVGGYDANSNHPSAGRLPPVVYFPLVEGVRSRVVAAGGLRQHVYESGQPGAEPVVLIHGNAASARFYEHTLARLGERFYCVAPDLRGYGASEARPVDATRGLRDFADDVAALTHSLGLEQFHLVGWSLGGNIAMQFTIDHPQRVRTLLLESAGSPFGYGATHGADGAVNIADYAGSGAGLINPTLIELLKAKDTTADSPFSARSAMRHLYVKEGFTYDPRWEDALVEQMLLMQIGEQYYPGDSVPSPNWPYTAPGVYGANNALSPKYGNLLALADITPKPPILWAHGADDIVVSDQAMVDPGMLGKLGLIPGWPGDEVYPPQPMVTQLRMLLDRYAANGGSYREEVIPDCGHSPHIEYPDMFVTLAQSLITGAQAR